MKLMLGHTKGSYLLKLGRNEKFKKGHKKNKKREHPL